MNTFHSISLAALAIVALPACSGSSIAVDVPESGASAPSPAPVVSQQAEARASWSLRMVDSHGVADFDCNTKHCDSISNAVWDYVSGLVATSVLEVWQNHPEREDLYQAVRSYAVNSTSEDGSQLFRNGGKPALGESNIDDLAAARIFFPLYKRAKAEGNEAEAKRWRTAADVVRNKLKFNHSRIAEGLPGAGGFWHKKRYPNQMWLDGLFMGPAVYARWQAEFGEEEGHEANMASWSDIAHQFKTLFAMTYDTLEHLNYHGWSATPKAPDSFWAKQTAPNLGCNAEFWGRAMGWYTGALVDVLSLMPKDHPDYPVLADMLRQSAKDLAARQDKATGLWFNLLRYDGSVSADGKGDVIDGVKYNVGTRANYTESSASAMFAYVFMKGARIGVLSDEMDQVGRRAFEGLLANKIIDEGNDRIGIKDICASAGLGPANDKGRSGTLNYYLEGTDTGLVKSNEGKGIGTFILAAIEYEYDRVVVMRPSEK